MDTTTAAPKTRRARLAILTAAREAAANGEHAVARALFSQVGVQYLEMAVRS